MSIFLNVNTKYLVDKIHQASSSVIYASAGINQDIASALINTAKKIGVDNVSVLLDVSEHVMRLGYGDVDGVTLLQENNISIKEAPGLRVGALLCDGEGVIFTPTPLLIEAEKNNPDYPNGIKASAEQIRDIRQAICPSKDRVKNSESVPVPEIGIEEVGQQQVKEVYASLKSNPPQTFDVARKVGVFSTAIEFVEIKLIGCKIQSRSVSVPSELLVGDVDREVKEQLSAGFKILEKTSKLSGGGISVKLNEIKKQYIKKIPVYGSVLLKANKEDFNTEIEGLRKDIETFKSKIKADLSKEIEQAKLRLAGALIPNIKKNPPKELLGQIMGDKPTDEIVKLYVEGELENIFPNTDSFIDQMSIDCIFKAVTYESISSKNFQKDVQERFPLVRWDKMFEEFNAARSSDRLY